MIDDADLERVGFKRWCLSSSGYAVRRGQGGHLVSLHRLLLGLAPGDDIEGDHINRDKLDNRRKNLRVVTHGEQMHNVPARDKTSSLRGVSYCRQTDRWRATARVGGRQVHLGRFVSEGRAAEAAAAFRAKEMSHATD